MPDKLVLMFTKERESKKIAFFAEQGTGSPLAVGRLHVRKDAVSGIGGPKYIRVTIEPA